MKCELTECCSGKPATRSAVECLGDGAWNISLCQECFDVLGLPRDGCDITCTRKPGAGDLGAKVNLALRAHYSLQRK